MKCLRKTVSLTTMSTCLCVSITKTSLYNIDPLKPHFIYSKIGVYRGIHYFSYFCSKTLWILVRTASSRRFSRVPAIYVLNRNMKKYQNFLSEIFHFLVVKFSVYLNRHVFVMKICDVWTHLVLSLGYIHEEIIVIFIR